DPAQHSLFVVPRRLEDARDELRKQRLETAELLREVVNERATLLVTLLLYPVEQNSIEPVFQRLEFGIEEGCVIHRNLRLGLVRECHAPDLCPLLPPEAPEKLVESGEQVALRDHDVERKAHAQPGIQLLDALPHCVGVPGPVRLVPHEKVGNADRDDRSVQRAPRTIFLQQVQETQPGRRIGLLLALLSGVTAGGIEQHRFVRKPPIAVAGSADALYGVSLLAVAERKMQPGVDQGGGFSGTRPADKRIPWQLIEKLLLPPAVLEPRLFQYLRRFFEALPERCHLLHRLGRRRVGLRAGRHALQQLLVCLPRCPPPSQFDAEPDRRDEHDQRYADDRAVERTAVIYGQRRPDEPDGERKRQHHQGAEEPAVSD